MTLYIAVYDFSQQNDKIKHYHNISRGKMNDENHGDRVEAQSRKVS